MKNNGSPPKKEITQIPINRRMDKSIMCSSHKMEYCTIRMSKLQYMHLREMDLVNVMLID